MVLFSHIKRPNQSRGPQSTGKTGETRTYAAKKYAGPVKKFSLLCPGFPQARWNFHLIWRNFHLVWRNFHLAWRNFYLSWRKFFLVWRNFCLTWRNVRLSGGILPGCAHGLVSFSPGMVGFLLFTWPGGHLIELIALHPAWYWCRSALHAIRPSLNTQTAAYYSYFYPRWRNFWRIWGRIFSFQPIWRRNFRRIWGRIFSRSGGKKL